jgi:hypothetical protein
LYAMRKTLRTSLIVSPGDADMLEEDIFGAARGLAVCGKAVGVGSMTAV